MKKLINAAENVVSESLAGFCAAHSDIVRMGEQAPFVQRRNKKPGKVALVSGGGSGHEPLHGGFVGKGMLDAACPGAVFTSPVPDQMLAATKAVDGGAGVVHIVKNYTGDGMNFKLAAEPGRRREKVKPAAEIVADMADAILGDLDLPSGSNVLAFVNGLGGTPLIELYIIYNELTKQLEARGLKATRNLVGDYITSLEMAGASITILALDDELTALWDAPVHTPALRWGA